MKKVLITGIDGFTARYLAKALEQQGLEVVGLSSVLDNPGMGVFKCDLLDNVRLNSLVKEIKPDYVAHLAAITFVGHSNNEDFYRVNVIGTMNLLEALCQPGLSLSKVLVASSANIYGTPNVEVIDEAMLPAPVNHYATSKLAMECMVRTMFSKLPIVITRPFNYTGFGQNEQFLIPKIIGHFKRGEKVIELGNLDVSRDFSDVRDVVASYVALLMSKAESTVVNICSGRATSLREIITKAEEIAGYDIEVRVNPAFVRANEIARLRGDNRYLKQLIGFSAEIPLEKTLRWMYEGKRNG